MSPRSSLCLLLCMMSLPPPLVPQPRNTFSVIQEWTELDFSFPSVQKRQEAINKRFFIPGDSIPIDVDVQYRVGQKPRIFMSIPRFDEGRAATLGVVQANGSLEPYPNYEWHDNQGNNCDGMTSVFRTAIDECNRLWVLDSGRINDNWACSAQVLAFDLNTDRLLHRYRISSGSLKPLSLLITPVVDIGATCDDIFLYLADVENFGLVVVDMKNKRDWRVRHRLFFPYPNRASFWIQGLGFDLMDGILGMALAPKTKSTTNRRLYFHALASTTENFINTADLKNASLFDADAPVDIIQVFRGERDSQSAAEAIDRNGIMYFGLMEPPRVACWNTATQFRPENILTIAEDRKRLQFLGGVKVINNPNGNQELWVLSNGFQKVMNDRLSKNSPNFRILKANINDLIGGTKCLRPNGFSGHRHSGNVILR